MRRFLSIFILLSGIIALHSRAQEAPGELDLYLSRKGMVDVGRMDTTIRVHLMYATPDNFMGKAVYKGLTKAWLHPKAADMLVKAQRLVRKQKSGWSLIVYDAARPMAVQRRMWALVRGTDQVNYVSNPANGGGLHNYGMAVDVTLSDESGTPVPMGTPFDFFGPEAHTTHEEKLVREGKLIPQEFGNRRFLRSVMQQAGFRVIPYEWWHFNACSRAEARQSYPVLD